MCIRDSIKSPGYGGSQLIYIACRFLSSHTGYDKALGLAEGQEVFILQRIVKGFVQSFQYICLLYTSRCV